MAIATGLRVVPVRNGTSAQVETLEAVGTTGARVVAVVPGDVRHLRLWEQLMKPEAEWTSGMETGEKGA